MTQMTQEQSTSRSKHQQEQVASQRELYTLVLRMEDKPAVLIRISSLFHQRNYNIESLSVGHSETPGISRMTVVVRGDDQIADRVTKQLSNLINVIEAKVISRQSTVDRELALIKVRTTDETRDEVAKIVRQFEGRIVYEGEKTMVIEITDSEQQVDTLFESLVPYGIVDMGRTGRVSMVCAE